MALKLMKTTIVILFGALVLSASLNPPLRAQAHDVLGFTASPYLPLVRGGPPTNDWLQLVCSSAGPVSWTATVNPDVPDQSGRSLGAAASAISVHPASGQFPVNGSQYLLIQIQAASSSQLKGVYDGTITFTATGTFLPPGQWNPSVNLNVRVEYATNNTVSVYPAAYFSRVDAGTSATQQVGLINLGPDHLYHWKTTVANGGSWLSVSPSAGNDLPNWQDAGYSGSETNLTLTANATGLAPGHYTCTLVITADNLRATSYTSQVQLDVRQPDVILDQKVAARGTVERITIHGQGFTSGSVPSFLKNDAPDANLVLSNLTVNPTQIQADLFVNANADLGPRTLKVATGSVNVFQTDALEVISIRPELSQGTTNSLGKLLVANHPTVLRAFVQSGRSIQNLDGLLYVFNGEQQMAGSPFAPNAPSPHSDNTGQLLCIDHPTAKDSYSDIEQFYLRDSINFYFGRDLPGRQQIPAGDWDFFVALSGTNLSQTPPSLSGLTKTDFLARKDFIRFHVPQTQTFRTTKPLRLLALVDYRLSAGQAIAVARAISNTIPYLAAAFPVDNTKLTLEVDRTFNSGVIDLDRLRWWGLNPFKEWAIQILNALEDRRVALNQGRAPDAQIDRIALVTDKVSVSAIADQAAGLSKIGLPSVIVGKYPHSVAHELGHSYGLYDTYDEAGAQTKWFFSPNPRRPDAVPEGNRVESGTVRLCPLHPYNDEAVVEPLLVLAGASTSIPTNPTNLPVVRFPGAIVNNTPFCKLSIMGNSQMPNQRWPDSTEWMYLAGQFSVGTHPLDLATNDLLTVNGIVDIAGNMDQVQVIRGPVAGGLPAAAAGDYSLEQLDSSGVVLSSQPFNVDFQQSGVGLIVSSALEVSAPFATGCAQVRLRKGAQVLYSRPVSANAPVAHVLTPTAGQAVSGPTAITWSATDSDGDPLTYCLYYLRDGVTPLPLASGVTSNSFLWNPAGYGGSAQARILVVASDGVNQGQSLSAAFTVPKKGPNLTILSPASGVAYPSYDTWVTFVGAGFDPEDGLLPSSALSFSSDIDGDLGTGEMVQRYQLSQGVHTITLMGYDSDGNTNQTSITLTISDNPPVPVLGSLSPTSGPPGSTVLVTGQNLDAAGLTVNFGTNAALVGSVTSTQCVVTVPAGLPAGDMPVTLTSGVFRSDSLQFSVTAGHPRILAVTPPEGPPGTPVMIRVAEYDPAANPTVRFGTNPALILDLTNLLVVVPSGLSNGLVNVTVSTTQGTSDPAAFQVTSGQPFSLVVLDSLSPASGQAGSRLTIQGSGFSSVLANNIVSLGSVTTVPLSVTANSLEVLIPPGIPQGPAPVFVSVDGYPSNPLWLTVSPSSADLAISQISHVTAAGLAFTITVENLGPGDATGLKITDSLPPGTAVLSAASTIGACSVTNRLLTCAINQLTNGGAAVVTLQLAVATPGLYTNVADVRGVEPDPVLSNNLARQVVQFTAPSPVLLIEFTGNSVRISWPATTPANVVLQTSPSLSPTSWADVPDAPTNVNGRFQVTQSIANQSHYYRLLIR